MNTRNTLPIFIFLTLLIVCMPVSAQADVSRKPFVYLRTNGEYGRQLVILANGNRYVFNITSESCWRLSPNTAYLAFTDPDTDMISIYDLNSGRNLQSIQNTKVSANCALRWINNTNLQLLVTQENRDNLPQQSFNVVTGMLEPIGQIESLGFPEDLLEDDFRLLSPSGNLIVYNRCPNAKYRIGLFDDDQHCQTEEAITVYDLESHETIATLEDTHQGMFVLLDYKMLFAAFGGIDWSPSGRYLIYRAHLDDLHGSRIRIYDVQNRQFIDTNNEDLDDLNTFKGFVWTANEESVAFWNQDFDAPGQQLVIIDITTHTMTVSDLHFDLAPARWSLGIENTFMFIDSDQQVLDSQVIDILSK
jgi:WD40 repeat protein